MTKIRKSVSFVLILLICVPMLLLLGGCKKPEYYVNGVRAKIYPQRGYASVCEIILSDTLNPESGICEIPAYVEYNGRVYPVKKVAPYGAILFSRGDHIICDGAVELIVPETVEEIDFEQYYAIYSRQFDQLERVTIHRDNSVYASENGVVYSKDGSELIFYPPGKTDTVFTVPKEMKTISEQEYNYCNAYIQTVEVEEGNAYLKAVDNTLCSFDGKRLIYAPCNFDNGATKYLTIPNGVEIITQRCIGFGNSNVDYLYIPQSVKEIEYTKSDTGYVSHALRRISYLYFESYTVPAYLTELDLERYSVNMHFGVSREDFLELVNSK